MTKSLYKFSICSAFETLFLVILCYFSLLQLILCPSWSKVTTLKLFPLLVVKFCGPYVNLSILAKFFFMIIVLSWGFLHRQRNISSVLSHLAVVWPISLNCSRAHALGIRLVLQNAEKPCYIWFSFACSLSEESKMTACWAQTMNCD